MPSSGALRYDAHAPRTTDPDTLANLDAFWLIVGHPMVTAVVRRSSRENRACDESGSGAPLSVTIVPGAVVTVAEGTPPAAVGNLIPYGTAAHPRFTSGPKPP